MIYEKGRTACFTGHRRLSQKDLPHLTKKLEKTLETLINQGVIFFINGGAIGFDTLAARAVLKARERNSGVMLIMALPCKNQDERWNEADKQAYRHLLENADDVVFVSNKPYYNGCMKERNKWLVEHSSVCVSYMKHGRSGTSQTVRMASEQGLTVINLAEH